MELGLNTRAVPSGARRLPWAAKDTPRVPPALPPRPGSRAWVRAPSCSSSSSRPQKRPGRVPRAPTHSCAPGTPLRAVPHPSGPRLTRGAGAAAARGGALPVQEAPGATARHRGGTLTQAQSAEQRDPAQGCRRAHRAPGSARAGDFSRPAPRPAPPRAMGPEAGTLRALSAAPLELWGFGAQRRRWRGETMACTIGFIREEREFSREDPFPDVRTEGLLAGVGVESRADSLGHLAGVQSQALESGFEL